MCFLHVCIAGLHVFIRQGDEDGLLEEQEERRRRQRQNERFHAFVKKVEDSLGKVNFSLFFLDMASSENLSNILF